MAGNAPQGLWSVTRGRVGPVRLYTQEQFPGVLTPAQSQKRAQSGHWLRPHQLLDGKLAGASKAKAVSQPESPMLGMFLVRLPFAKEQPICQNLLRSFLTHKQRDRKNQLFFFFFFEHPHMLSEACPQRTLLRNEPKGTIPPRMWFAIGQRNPSWLHGKIS